MIALAIFTAWKNNISVDNDDTALNALEVAIEEIKRFEGTLNNNNYLYMLVF